MEYILRDLSILINKLINDGQNILLLGARQTGKTTLIQRLKTNLSINLIEPETRLLYQSQPALLSGEIEALAESLKKPPLIFIDEIQKMPTLLDTIQSLIDRKVAQFILTGSSARKLKTSNLLPGRLIKLQLDPLNLTEASVIKNKEIDDFILDGMLPGIITITDNLIRELKLKSYVALYLEEEIRQEAAVRQLDTFTRFLSLAASQSGNLLNLQKLSQELGVAHTTIERYFEILEECLIIERIPAFQISNSKRQLVKAAKLLFFDLGVRRIAAQESRLPTDTQKGHLFEQWVGIEINKLIRSLPFHHQLNYWRDKNGIEVDWVLTLENKIIPIEVKWTNKPDQRDIKHLKIFLNEYADIAEKGYVICCAKRKIKLTENIYALPWQELPELFN